MTSRPEKPSSPDPLADLDDDLGDDWESAFQAEDFMFSPEDEPSDFFLFDENAPDQNEDIASLFTDQEDKGEGKAGPAVGASADEAEAEGAGVLEFPSRLQILAASLLQHFQGRTRPQRLLLGALPVALILIVVTTLFFRAGDDQLAPVNQQEVVANLQPAPQEQETSPAASKAKEPDSAPPPPQPGPEIETVQQKWQLPTFVIVASHEKNGELIINIDLTLIANIEKDRHLPEDQLTFVKDIIYQFYRNRPAYELKRFALARGEMISQLTAWLNKQWQNNPFDTITFSRYQVIQTSPSLAPKVTFM